MTDFRVVLVLPKSSLVLGLWTPRGYEAPMIHIATGNRYGRTLQQALYEQWGIAAFILEIFDPTTTSETWVVAEVLHFELKDGFEQIPLMALCSGLSPVRQRQLLSMLDRHPDSRCPVGTIGWLEEAINWIEAVTGWKVSSAHDPRQFNAGGCFSLICFHMDAGCDVWLKATGTPNRHELAVTLALAELCGELIPEVIAHRPEWNAWVASGQTAPRSSGIADPVVAHADLERAVEAMAELQARTLGSTSVLLEAGAFDQTPRALLRYSGILFDYLQEVMGLQTSTKVEPLRKPQIREVQTHFEHACRRLEELRLPQTILHGDLNRGNILYGTACCQFIDWSEAYVGFPLCSLQHLLLLDGATTADSSGRPHQKLIDSYISILSRSCDREVLLEGMLYMPLLGAASSLYGRGDWLSSPRRFEPGRQAYSRSVARSMYRATQAPELKDHRWR